MAEFLLPAQLDIRHVDTLRSELLAALAGHDTLVLDGRDVARVDTAGVQLLVSALLAEPVRVTGLVRASTALREAAAALGLERLHRLPDGEHADPA